MSKMFAKISIFGVLAACLLVLCACSTPEVLENNGSIPAPSLNPPENANELATKNLETEEVPQAIEQPTLLQTNTNVPGYQSNVQQSDVVYQVKQGDTLWKIAQMFQVSVNDLVSINKLDKNSPLKVGTILNIPSSGTAAPISENKNLK